jgi:hypothetical protein
VNWLWGVGSLGDAHSDGTDPRIPLQEKTQAGVAWPTVKEFDPEEFCRKLCTRTAHPERCVDNTTVLIRYVNESRVDTAFRPRVELETALSVLMAEGWPKLEVVNYVRQGRLVTPEILEKTSLFQTNAGLLRENGFAVVHTPGAIANGPHVSAVWPPDLPFEVQDPAWPPEVSAAFRACFNEVEET